jgi:hypothetical protein
VYRQRWTVEDSFKFAKICLGWKEVQQLDLTGIRCWPTTKRNTVPCHRVSPPGSAVRHCRTYGRISDFYFLTQTQAVSTRF